MPATTPECDRAAHCLNFWLKERPTCNECDALINMNHFHHTLKGYRICHDCFEKNLEAIAAGTFTPATYIEGERRVCLKYAACFAEQPYGLYQPKICDICGQLAPPEHYHDISKNIRICLTCYRAGRGR